MMSINEDVKKRVDQDRANGKTGFDRDAYNRSSSVVKNAIDTATNT